MIDVIFTIFWVLVAIGFYRIRCASRLLYGAIEIVAGIATIVLGEFPPYAVLTSDATWTLGSRAAHILTLLGPVSISSSAAWTTLHRIFPIAGARRGVAFSASSAIAFCYGAPKSGGENA